MPITDFSILRIPICFDFILFEHEKIHSQSMFFCSRNSSRAKKAKTCKTEKLLYSKNRFLFILYEWWRIYYETVLFWFKLAMADRVVVEALKQTGHSFTWEFKLKNILQTANKSWKKYKMIVVSMKSKQNHVQKISNCGWL